MVPKAPQHDRTYRSYFFQINLFYQEPLTASMLAAAPPQEQKQMLGERLFPLIQRMYPDLAGKKYSNTNTVIWSNNKTLKVLSHKK